MSVVFPYIGGIPFTPASRGPSWGSRRFGVLRGCGSAPARSRAGCLGRTDSPSALVVTLFLRTRRRGATWFANHGYGAMYAGGYLMMLLMWRKHISIRISMQYIFAHCQATSGARLGAHRCGSRGVCRLARAMHGKRDIARKWGRADAEATVVRHGPEKLRSALPSRTERSE